MRWVAALAAVVVVCIGCNAILGIGAPTVVPEEAGAGGVGVVGDAGGSLDGSAIVIDGGTPLPSGPCVVSPQSGCAAGSTCSPLSATSTTCVPAGSNKEGFPCTGESSCAPGLLCYDGACHKPCTNLGGNCTSSAGTTCIRFPYDRDAGNDHVTDTQLDAGTIGVCRIECDPTDPNACGGPDGGPGGPVASCTVLLAFADTTDCRTASSTNTETCQSTSECRPGYVCTVDSPQSCRQLCKVPGTCGPGGANGPCESLFEPIFVRGYELSYCYPD
jgi:hypothetical protein